MSYRKGALALSFAVVIFSSCAPTLAEGSASSALTEQALQLIQSGNSAKASDFLTKAIYSDPANMKARRLLAQINLDCGNTAAATSMMQQVVKVDRGADNLCVMGDCYFALGHSKEARTQYVEALKTTPDHLRSIIGLINIAQNDRDLASAKALCTQGMVRVHDRNGQLQLRRKLAELENMEQPVPAAGPKADS